jgi:hypothetical protein
MHKLNPKEIDSLPPGTYGGNNLYLVIKGGSRAYMLRYSWQGRPRKWASARPAISS